ncbi:MAG TPA: Fe-S protein assembly co-chaperone HscB [Phycisphaerales bacterium]|nr:Fe-S protein assembly co-chaperone HscB [Phycisphaerales bacterium]HCD32196.1 Fe-S protein assembly co-chaperone HscB [Phycisphaerales bacterium]|tara:strand:+ start:527 stop:1045 length:519 start_codon:yes stop_codon:yes gene_type:complete
MQPNPFELLSVPMQFDVDAKALHRAFVQQSAANHPDRFLDPLDQADAADKSAAINKAYLILKNPFDRAAAMIALLADTPIADSKQLPAGLLMEMMEIREELEDAQASKNQAELHRLKQWANEQESQYLQTIAEALNEAATLPASDRSDLLNKATEQLNALRYIQRMLEEFGE